MVRRLNESADSERDWIAIIEDNRDKIKDAIIELGRDAYGSVQQDLYLYDDGTLDTFSNTGGNSWLDGDDSIVVWDTNGYEYASLTDYVDYRDLIDIFKENTNKNVDAILNDLMIEYECDTLDELNHEIDWDRELSKIDDDAYEKMLDDIYYGSDLDEWANDIIDRRIEELEEQSKYNWD